MKKNIEELKNQKQKAENDFKEELDRLNVQLAKAKCELASSECEKDSLEKKYKRYINKLKDKLSSIGYKFQPKKK